MTVEIETTRGLAAQILRHRSFTFQEFSLRYAATNLLADEIPMFDLRHQDTKNRQNSTDDVPKNKKKTSKRRSQNTLLKRWIYTMNSSLMVLRRSVRDLFSH